MNAEKRRLLEAARGEGLWKQHSWKKWGPYLSERQWGTVREDYSPRGRAWSHVTHDMARSKAYRWGEEGLAGLCDDRQLLCFNLGLWNGRDPFLKERLFGLTGPQGNHGEDVKELYYYLDSTPTHSYMRMLYKYPQAEFPYARLIEENKQRGLDDGEFELLDTGLLDDDRYFDVFVEYAKAAPEDVLIRITAHNRGDESAVLHLVPQLWFRDVWSWGREMERPRLAAEYEKGRRIAVHHPDLPDLWLHADHGFHVDHGSHAAREARDQPEFLFCDNATNVGRLYSVHAEGYFKDGINHFLVDGLRNVVNPEEVGTKAAAAYRFEIPAGEHVHVDLRLNSEPQGEPFAQFDSILNTRQREADAFYAELQEGIDDEDARLVQRQAFAGMLWSKQFYYFDVDRWLDGDPGQPPIHQERKHGRNADWRHLHNEDILSMPDKWEYPWYAVWDSAFHAIPLAQVDADFAKGQLLLLTRDRYMHPNGQLPAYEWSFSDVNPPVHAWAAHRVFQIDRKARGDDGDLDFLERVFHKLMINFTWWVNRNDIDGRNVFQGGFLGLDNIGVFNRSDPAPTGGHIHQSDGTGWMAMYALNLMRIALDLAVRNRVYEDAASKFFEHFLYIAKAMTGLWNEEDGFFYDHLHLPDGRHEVLKVRSLVGLIPLFAVETLEPETLERFPDFRRRLDWFLTDRPQLASLVSRWYEDGRGHRRLLSLLRGHRMKLLLRRMLDETEFLSEYGVRSLSRHHADSPYRLEVGKDVYSVGYLPAESDSGLFGGNSNWRGPVWFPVNYLIIESLQKFHHYYGDDFLIEYPTGSGAFVTILDVANELSHRLTRIFLRDSEGFRPAHGQRSKLQRDPHFRDHLLFHEYFHGDDGRGLGASHQTGWTGLVAKLLQPREIPV